MWCLDCHANTAHRRSAGVTYGATHTDIMWSYRCGNCLREWTETASYPHSGERSAELTRRAFPDAGAGTDLAPF